MPFTVSDAPKAVRDALPKQALKIWVAACNSALKQYKGDETTAYKVAWNAVKAKYKRTQDGEWVAKADGAVASLLAAIAKLLGHDVGETSDEDGPSSPRSEVPDALVPGPDAAAAPPAAGPDPAPGPSLKAEAAEATITATVLKVDAPKRLVWGWASVIEEGGRAVVDKQGDVITQDELVAAVHDFTKTARAARVMHDGVDLGEVVETCVFTRDLQKALGVDMGKVGWLLGMEMPAAVVERVARGELSMFSIGGQAIREEITDGD